ncbi:putative nucleotide-diphospho-sugar transferase [Neobacillus sp. OS1-2]|uniref:putative nucleotide-diphospho-sugar transferase n=1 Tax=Neobacillus sp. OS1-2 TaxID=3070680 RepID=UPI0027E13EE4|nr:putative nucleotide-diphospho-sugar transferase [Neobacillus sp. OS1-2]WML39503.1 putative nucleotide-diphospho-sugar transferase [Neobacillus sp. OS1-2]
MELSSLIRYFQLKYPILNWGQSKSEVIGKTSDNDDSFHFCVIASKDYTIKVVAQYESLCTHSTKFKLWVCCIDSLAYETLKKLNLEHMILFYVEQLEDQTLRTIRNQRKQNEYCWTLKAPLIHYLLTTFKLKSIVYCDGDIFFFSDPGEIFKEWGKASVYLCPQRDVDWVEKKYGRFQAGLIGFRNDDNGLKSLKWWRNRCEEWCFAEPDNNRFGDQKYLDKIPELFSNIKISTQLGINAAPWNCVYNNNFTIHTNNNGVLIEKDPLIAYHFACFSIYNPDEYDLWSLDSIKLSRAHKKYMYEPYIEKIREVIQVMKDKDINMDSFYSANDSSHARTYYKYTNFRKRMDETDHFYCFATIISKEYLLKGLALYQSLTQHADAFHLWICSMDNESYNTLVNLGLEHATILPVEAVGDNVISSINHDRSLKESCWSMKAPFIHHVLEQYKEIDHLVYCDADMYFFSNPKPIFDEWAKYSIFLSTQRSTKPVEKIHGIYQAGLIGFKQEKNSLKILNWWREKCLEWCYDSPHDEERWGDQKYLNRIPNLFSNIKVIKHEGIDAAPWNMVMKEEQKVSLHEGSVLVNNHELVCFHFGSLLMVQKNKFDLWKLEKLPFSKSILLNIYYPYLLTLRQLYTDLQSKGITKQTNLLTTIPSTYTPLNPIMLEHLEKAYKLYQSDSLA